MKRIIIGAGVLALFLALPAGAASPAAPAPAAPSPPPAPMMAPAMSAMDNHIDGELAFLKAELKITDSQEREWNNFAKAAQEGNKEIAAARAPMASGKVTDMLDARAKLLKSRLEVLEKLKDELTPLYEDLDAGQKAAADQLIPMHLGMLIM